MTTLTQVEKQSAGQLKLLTRMIGDVADSDQVQEALKALDKEGAERLKGHPEFVDSLREFTIKRIRELSVTNQFANEEVQSNYTYPPEYRGPRPIEEQIKAIAEIFELDPTAALAHAKTLPSLALRNHGRFAVPLVAAIAKKHFAHVTDPAEQYCLAVQFAIDRLAKSRRFYNYREGQIDVAHLRRHVRTAKALEEVVKVQTGDILVLDCQLGIEHRGRSVRRARECFVSNEAGLGALELISIVLVHPERLVRWEELDMDGAGDEVSLDGARDFSYASLLCFFRDDRVKFDARSLGHASADFGAASFRVPQS